MNFLTRLPREQHYGDTGSLYQRQSFLTIQNAIEREFLRSTTNTFKNMPKVHLRRFPYPASDSDDGAKIMSLLSGFIIISFIFSCKNIIKVR